jgi:hypothetical protein
MHSNMGRCDGLARQEEAGEPTHQAIVHYFKLRG